MTVVLWCGSNFIALTSQYECFVVDSREIDSPTPFLGVMEGTISADTGNGY